MNHINMSLSGIQMIWKWLMVQIGEEILNLNGNISVKQNDLIIYIDGNSNPTSIYMVYSISGTSEEKMFFK